MKKPTPLVILIALLVSTTGWASMESSSCYQQLELKMPENNINRALYIFIDQTMPLNARMQSTLNELLSEHPKRGEQVRIARFSPNIKGQYTELTYEGFLDSKPSEAYLYHLRDKDNRALQTCIEEQKIKVKQAMQSAIKHNLQLIDTQLPRTELLYALKRLSETVLVNDQIENKTVLIISDGLENSEVTSFYRRRNIAPINVEKEIAKVNKHNLIANWHGANLYMFGLGNIKDERRHIKPSQLEMLKKFWNSYFSAGGAVVKELGTPAPLTHHL